MRHALGMKMTQLLLPILVAASAWAASACLAAAQESVLYDLTLDVDKDGSMDRAVLVLVGPSPAEFTDAAKEFYILAEGERADLYVYLGGGDADLDISQQPDLLKESLVTSDQLKFAMPLGTNSKGSLNVVSSNGFGNTGNVTETLTIVYRDSRFLVAGLEVDWSLREDSSECSINFLSGKAVKRLNDEKGLVLKARFKPIPLTDWSDETRPTVCEE